MSWCLHTVDQAVKKLSIMSECQEQEGCVKDYVLQPKEYRAEVGGL